MLHQETKEEKDWQGVKKMFLNSKMFMLTSFATICTAMYQTYSSKSRSSEDIREKFDAIIAALKDIPAIKETVEALTGELAKAPEKGAQAGQALLTKLIDLLNTQLAGNPELVENAIGLKKHVLGTTSNYNDLRGVALGGIAAIVGGALVLDFLQQMKLSLNPGNRTQLAVNGTMSLAMVTLLILRAKTCFSDDYLTAPSGYACSQAEDPTARGFNNAMIEIGFLGAADVALRFLNSCFLSGAKQTFSNIGTAITDIPGGISTGYYAAKQRVSLWLNPGDEVSVKREGAPDVSISVGGADEPLLAASQRPSAPTLGRRGEE